MEKNLDVAQIDLAIRELFEGLNASVAPALKQFARGQEKYVALLADAEKRLSAELSDDNPRLAALRDRLGGAVERRDILLKEASRREKFPDLHADERMVHGRLRDTEGKPLAGLRVRVFDRDRKFDDLLGETTTDDEGEFFVTYHDRDFNEIREANPELFVMVVDRRGRALFTSTEKVSLKETRFDHFDIVMSRDQPPETPTPRPQPTPAEPVEPRPTRPPRSRRAPS
jgi:hypothetical protein